MNQYQLGYSLWDPKNPPKVPTHKTLTFESENDILAALDEGLSQVYDANPDKEILGRFIQMTNAKTWYEANVEIPAWAKGGKK